MCCWGVQAEHSKSECVFSLHANSSLWRRHSCRLRACVRDSFCIPSQRPTQTPTQNQNSKEIPMSCRFTWRMSIIVAEFPPRFSHTSIHQGCQCNTNGTTTTTKARNSLLIVMTLFTRRRLGYKNDKRRSITFGALAACCSNIYDATL